MDGWMGEIARILEVGFGGEYKAKLVVDDMISVLDREELPQVRDLDTVVMGFALGLRGVRKVLESKIEERRRVEREMAESQRGKAWRGHPFFFVGADKGA